MRINRKIFSKYVAKNIAKTIPSPYVFEFVPVAA